MLPEVLSHALLVFVCAAISVYAFGNALVAEESTSDLPILIGSGSLIYAYLFLETPIYVLAAAVLTAIVGLVLLVVGIVLRSFTSMFRLSLLVTSFATLGISYGVLTDLPLLTGEIATYGLLLFFTVVLGVRAYAESEQRYGNDLDGLAQRVPEPRPDELWPPEDGTGEGQFSSEREG